MSFPENCIKGIPNDNFLNEQGYVASHLFNFNQGDRGDGWVEESIKWEDADTVVTFTMCQRKTDGALQFRSGTAIIPREELDRLNRRPPIRGLLSYERQPIDGNPYHGNILLKANTSKPTMRQIAAGIALAVARVIPPT